MGRTLRNVGMFLIKNSLGPTIGLAHTLTKSNHQLSLATIAPNCGADTHFKS